MKKSFAIYFLISLLSTSLFCQVPRDDMQAVIKKEVEGKRSKSNSLGTSSDIVWMQSV